MFFPAAIKNVRSEFSRNMVFYSTGGYQDAGFTAVNLDPELKVTSSLPAPVISGRKYTGMI